VSISDPSLLQIDPMTVAILRDRARPAIMIDAFHILDLAFDTPVESCVRRKMDGMRNKGIFACIAIFILSGFAPPPSEYQPPDVGLPTARIRLVNNFPGSVVRPLHLPGDSCFPGTAQQAEWMPRLDQGKRETIGIPMTDLAGTVRFTEHMIIAGVPTIFQFGTAWPGGYRKEMTCLVAIRFTPQAGADYEAVFSHRSDPEGCAISLRRLHLDAAGRTVEEPMPEATSPPHC